MNFYFLSAGIFHGMLLVICIFLLLRIIREQKSNKGNLKEE